MAGVAGWYVIHTRPGLEVDVSRDIRALGLDAYCPIATRWAKPRHRKAKARVKVQRPAFPRYVFVRVEGLRWAEIRAVHGVAGVVCAGQTPIQLTAREVEDVKAAEDMGCFDFTATDLRGGVDLRIAVGDRIVLTSGPLDGYVATVTRLPRGHGAGRDRTVGADVSMFGGAAAVVVPLDKFRILA